MLSSFHQEISTESFSQTIKMSVHSSKTENADKTANYSLGVTHGDENRSLSASAGVNGYNHKNGSYRSVDGNLGVNVNGHGANASIMHSHGGNAVSAAANLNALKTDNHRVDVHAHSTLNMPKQGPNFSTHGGGVNYQFQDRLGANASISRTPLAGQTNYSVGGSAVLHQTPTSNLNFNAGAQRSNGPFGRSNWQPGASFQYNKKF